MEERIQTEKKFHNKTFQEGTRKQLSSFYSIARISNGYYKQVLFSECKGKKVLELGCGTGNYSFQLAEHGALVTGIDISEVAIEQAKTRLKNKFEGKFIFQVMNAEALEFDDDSFDMVCGISILHHLNLSNVYSEIVRVLKPQGKAIFIEPLGHNPLINLFRSITPRLRTEDEHPLRNDDIVLANSWFSSSDLRFFHFFTIFAVPFSKSDQFSRILNVFSKFDQCLFRNIPFLRKYSWIVVAIFTK